MHHDDFDCWLVLGVRSRPLDLMSFGGGPPQGASQKGNQVNQIQPRLGSKEHLDVFGGVSLFSVQLVVRQNTIPNLAQISSLDVH